MEPRKGKLKRKPLKDDESCEMPAKKKPKLSESVRAIPTAPTASQSVSSAPPAPLTTDALQKHTEQTTGEDALPMLRVDCNPHQLIARAMKKDVPGLREIKFGRTFRFGFATFKIPEQCQRAIEKGPIRLFGRRITFTRLDEKKHVGNERMASVAVCGLKLLGNIFRKAPGVVGVQDVKDQTLKVIFESEEARHGAWSEKKVDVPFLKLSFPLSAKQPSTTPTGNASDPNNGNQGSTAFKVRLNVDAPRILSALIARQIKAVTSVTFNGRLTCGWAKCTSYEEASKLYGTERSLMHVPIEFRPNNSDSNPDAHAFVVLRGPQLLLAQLKLKYPALGFVSLKPLEKGGIQVSLASQKARQELVKMKNLEINGEQLTVMK